MRRRKHEQNRRTDRKNCPDGEGHKKLEDIATIQREGNLQKKDLVNEGIRWTLTIAATIINALGVAFITTAALGTAIPNVLAIVQDRFTLGQYLFALSVLQLVLQFVLLKKNFRPIQITQMIPAVLLSYFVDFFFYPFHYFRLATCVSNKYTIFYYVISSCKSVIYIIKNYFINISSIFFRRFHFTVNHIYSGF